MLRPRPAARVEPQPCFLRVCDLTWTRFLCGPCVHPLGLLIRSHEIRICRELVCAMQTTKACLKGRFWYNRARSSGPAGQQLAQGTGLGPQFVNDQVGAYVSFCRTPKASLSRTPGCLPLSLRSLNFGSREWWESNSVCSELNSASLLKS